VHDALGVGRVEGIGNLYAPFQQLVDRDRMPGDPRRERRALQQLHGDEVPALVLVDVVDGADVGMVQRRSRARLALESLQRLRVLLHLFRQELQRYAAAQARVLGFIHHAHAATTQPLQHPIMRNR